MTMQIRQPVRASHTYRQHLHAPAERVFPLLCPVREVDWAVGWAPRLVVSRSGVAERDCVFVTPGDADAVWYVTRHEPENLYVEMLKVTPEVTACRLDIQLVPRGGECFADVSYMHTSLGPKGDTFVAAFTADYYAGFMQAWEKEMNHYLATGKLFGT
jgi:hypothetical protein